MEDKNVDKPSKIVPTEQEVELLGKTYTLRKWSLRVDAWIEEKFKMEKKDFLENLNSSRFAHIVFHLLKDKKDFAALEVEDYDDDGKLKKRVLTGPERIMEAIETPEQQTQIAKAVFRSYGLSQAIVEDIVRMSTKKKKK